MSAGPPNLQDVASRQGMQIKNGGITLTTGGWIRAGQTNYNVGSGWFVGYSGGVPKLSLGSAAGSYLTWDGSTLTVSGSIVAGSITGATFNVSTTGYVRGGQTAYDTGTGFFLGYSGAAYKFSIGDATHKLTWNGTTLGLIGDITGISSINITGTASFGGATSALGSTYALTANLSGTGSVHGLYGLGGTGGNGVTGAATNGYGVIGDATSGIGVRASSSSGTALQVLGPMTISSTTAVSNLNADMVDGQHAAAFATAGHNHTGTYETVANVAKALIYQTTGTPGTPGVPAGYFSVKSTDGTVGPVYIAYYV